MIISFMLQGILSVSFSVAGIQKIMGDRRQVDMFKNLRLPQWFRVVTGWVQLVGVVGLIIGFWLPWVVVIAGLWFAVTMLVAMLAHIRVKDPFRESASAFMFLVVSFTLSMLRFSELQGILS
ncbi:DoxX family protein [Virgibacillus oceani]